MNTAEKTLPKSQTAEKGAVNYKVIVGASLGNGLEIFDFTVYSFFAAIIGKLYFPSDSAYGSLLMSVAVFGVGFIMRPLGSMVLGAYADRVGRKAAMLMTIVLMGVGTALIAFAPTHAQIGVLAPVLIVVGRLIQGFAAGGEVGSATTLLLESAGANQRGFFVSWQAISQGVSALLGASCGLALTYFLSEEALYAWGWRVPFIIGLLIIPVGVYIRKHLEETYSGEQPDRARVPLNPVWDLVSNHAKDLLLGVLVIMSGTVMVYVVLLYMPTYMMQTYRIAGPTAYLFSCIASVVQIVAVYYAGRYVDRIQNYKRPLLFSIFAALILIYPTFWFLSATQTLWLAIVFRILLIGALGINMLSSTMLIVSALPRHVRATGTSMIYAFGVTLFGGSAQLIVTWLLDVSDNPLAPAWYVTGMLTVSLIATLLFRERHTE
ncbi:Proline porter II [Serratia marcescens]|jgi:MHS family proline/betaine transporter-like MFS transporter|uniref:MFS transporter n=1 Tax=Serratia marcescens TaxID=615 RepID=A0AAP8PMN0_SERMA|nr:MULTISPECIES: MFS transporter [Serratia]ELI8814584.1 MFS transporter [Serratia marcescens]ELI8843471.1 MFS transporter [Serratia marcescens]MBH1892287.1 MFS transporter [Serratia marcescens]MBH2706292.1 MFS transporter [Serratia marcescens]MBH2842969.1 MFS transporter [Serratia marcescens]